MKKSVIITIIAVIAALAVGFIFGKISGTDEERFLDMETVVDWESSEDGLMLYTEDGDGYYWER